MYIKISALQSSPFSASLRALFSDLFGGARAIVARVIVRRPCVCKPPPLPSPPPPSTFIHGGCELFRRGAEGRGEAIHVRAIVAKRELRGFPREVRPQPPPPPRTPVSTPISKVPSDEGSDTARGRAFSIDHKCWLHSTRFPLKIRGRRCGRP